MDTHFAGFINSLELNILRKKVFVLVAILLVIIAACSTQKNTSVTRTYHNVTSKYNVLFNGMDSYNKGLKKMEGLFEDDYSEILPVFQYSDPEVAKSISSDMDRTVKKSSKLISLHSITVKPKVKNTKSLSSKEREFFNKREYNRYVDDAYLLMGKAYFHKHDFGLAEETFRLILADFKNDPVVYETQIWLARVYIETKQYKNSEEILNFLSHNENFPKRLFPDLYSTYADYYLRQNNLKAAIESFEKILSLKLERKYKIRYSYILAQLYEKTGDLKKATDFYGQVIKMNPPYTMAFNARINRALTYQQGFGSSGEIEKELLKMLKDDKNLDYRDQIYYALGDLAYKEGNTEKAKGQYKKSIQYNTKNADQKARSYLTLADIYYSQLDYVNAQVYYDSTVALLDPAFKSYELINTKSVSLTRLVSEINTFTLEDSVQRLASLPEQELLAFIDKIIEQVRKEEELNRIREHERALDEQFGREMATQNVLSQTDATAGTKWYFYNDAAKNMGYKEFKLKWGNRKLEDHWQRQNKAIAAFAPISENGEDSDSVNLPEKQFSNKTREYYLQNVPRNDSMMQASHKRTESALYNMGLIYKNELKDNIKAEESLKELIKRYPNTEQRLSVYYNLYTLAREEGNQAMMYNFQNKIITEFPQSIYAKIMTNPEYLKEVEAEEKKISRYYEETYDYYTMGNYIEVISRASFILTNHPADPMVPQFDYLRALSLGKSSDSKVFREALNEIVLKYPNTEVSDASRNILSYMNKVHPELLAEEEKILAEKLYEVSENAEHYVAFIVNKNSNNNQLLFNLINFNLDNFDNNNLKIETVEINARQNLLVIKAFPNKQESAQYMNTLKADPKVLNDYNDPSVNVISISAENFGILLEDKSPERYLKFFTEHYQ
jgi:tetratricopeptide (TPR) repeat protein